MRHILLFFFVLLSAKFNYAQEGPTNIILMIGDGTGLSQITAGMYANETKPFRVISCNWTFKTHSSNALVTDSAASGTAMACG